MDLIVQALYWISSGLLIPTIVLLLLFLAQGLFVVGGFYGLYAHRMAYEKSVKPALQELSMENARAVLAPDHIRKTGLVNLYLESFLSYKLKLLLILLCQKSTDPLMLYGCVL